MRIKIVNIFLFLYVVTLSVNAQNKTIDSLKIALKKARHDTIRCAIYNAWAKEIYIDKPDSAMLIWNKSLVIAKEGYDKGGANKKIFLNSYSTALSNIAFQEERRGDTKKALEFYERSLKIEEDNKNQKGIELILNYLGEYYSNQGNIEMELECYERSLKIANKIDDKANTIYCLNAIAYIFEKQSNFQKSLEYLTESLKLAKEINDKEKIANISIYLGSTYERLGDGVKAINYSKNSLSISEEIKDTILLQYSLNELANIYSSHGDSKLAIEYLKRLLKINERVNEKDKIAQVLSNMGTTYSRLGEKKLALKFYEKGLNISNEIGDKYLSSHIINNIGEIYLFLNELPKALDYARKSLQISEEIDNNQVICESTSTLADILLKMGALTEAEKHALKSLTIAKKIGDSYSVKNAASILKEIYKKQSKFEKAIEMYDLETLMKDSIKTSETEGLILKNQLQIEYKKKVLTDSIKNAEEQKVKSAQLFAQNAQLKQEKIQRFALYSGLALVLIFTGFIFNRFKLTQKQKAIIEIKEKETQEQKQIIEEKHKEISDSINYAERIQRALLASKKMLDQNLNNYFILFKPKDVVSGDFYWATKLQNSNFAIVTADSTGHGVPGAIMSIVNIASLDKAIAKGITSPDLILNETRSLVVENLKNDGSEEGGKDGMDASLLSFDFNNNLLQCAAANNPIWIIRNNELIEIKADRMPIGKHDRDSTPFTLHTITLQKGDTIYTLTDGFPDQFGGEGGKKFKSKQLQTILLSIANEPMEIQKQKLSDAFDNWKGKLEQVDDVTVIGIRI